MRNPYKDIDEDSACEESGVSLISTNVISKTNSLEAESKDRDKCESDSERLFMQAALEISKVSSKSLQCLEKTKSVHSHGSRDADNRSRCSHKKTATLIKELKDVLVKEIAENEELQNDRLTLLKTCFTLSKQRSKLENENTELQNAHESAKSSLKSILQEVQMKEFRWNNSFSEKALEWQNERLKLQREINRLKIELIESKNISIKTESAIAKVGEQNFLVISSTKGVDSNSSDQARKYHLRSCSGEITSMSDEETTSICSIDLDEKHDIPEYITFISSSIEKTKCKNTHEPISLPLFEKDRTRVSAPGCTKCDIEMFPTNKHYQYVQHQINYSKEIPPDDQTEITQREISYSTKLLYRRLLFDTNQHDKNVLNKSNLYCKETTHQTQPLNLSWWCCEDHRLVYEKREHLKPHIVGNFIANLRESLR